jgi:hypothetical protein
MRTGIILPIVAGLVVSVLIVAAGLRARRKRRIPELNKHPERLEQMLDSTDDA